ncbi:DUF4113 domain-containing protein [Hahella sp. CR1]|nr:DUF4113 domain-containing protein [Hahella sp. CR1]MDG9671635.1 DUF4113 domain-containing protein [Hahella sp. CR1]
MERLDKLSNETAGVVWFAGRGIQQPRRGRLSPSDTTRWEGILNVREPTNFQNSFKEVENILFPAFCYCDIRQNSSTYAPCNWSYTKHFCAGIFF